jgi:hypothetical protein
MLGSLLPTTETSTNYGKVRFNAAQKEVAFKIKVKKRRDKKKLTKKHLKKHG